jgi:chromosome segregation ATPase
MEVGIWGMVGGVVTTFATAATTWAFSRKQSKVEIDKLRQEVETMEAKRESDVKTAEIEIMERYRELYNAMVEDLGKQLSQIKVENELIRKENVERRDLSDSMRREIQSLHIEIDGLRKELTQLKSDFPCADCPRRVKTKA